MATPSCDVFFAAADLDLATGNKLVCAPLLCGFCSKLRVNLRPTLRHHVVATRDVVRFSIVVARNTTKRYKSAASFYFRKFFFCCNFASSSFSYHTRNNKTGKLHLVVTQRFCLHAPIHRKLHALSRLHDFLCSKIFSKTPSRHSPR